MSKPTKLQFLSLAVIVVISLLGISQSVKAQQTTVVDQAGCVREPEAYIPSGTLVALAYRGMFKEQGIPGYDVFTTGFKSGQITAQKIVQAAVSACVLSNKYGMATQENYISDVQQQVQLFIQNSK